MLASATSTSALRRLGISLLPLLLSACASQQDTPPEGTGIANSLLRGELEDGHYRAADGSFSVDTPFRPGSDAYSQMHIGESFDISESQVQFTSSAAPIEVYRVHLFKGDLPADGELYRQATAQYFQLFEERYHTTLEPINLQDHRISGVSATSATFGQHIPQRSALGLSAEAVDIWHSYYYLERGDNAAFIWINRPQPDQAGASAGAEERIEAFIDSFELTSKALR
ncbi:MAG: hypothetical protein V7756_01250 [Halopseudomonas sp.]|uniref:hypothetical protein n=1 Tax=Halopseudomonas sp. TaxID=2901191 RepID=UPI003002BB42